ncbi:hypothetical protein BN1012_Phect3147 [Candidatus Phaeomarinobacter ectocarpi]|uniref:Uncharacterized protein n=1 Tax=Candidatus Phaeomarinibacter ectocarpi TaxID=1458461 RepID=X5MHR7_9HYPH|nr:hypothetical protein BN1012_Phect3147 [Candidatus Phaeomarinobacter ectocarpi]
MLLQIVAAWLFPTPALHETLSYPCFQEWAVRGRNPLSLTPL